MLTVGLLAVVVYLYTVVAFNFFRKFYNKSSDEDEPDMKCDDMMTVSDDNWIILYYTLYYNTSFCTLSILLFFYCTDCFRDTNVSLSQWSETSEALVNWKTEKERCGHSDSRGVSFSLFQCYLFHMYVGVRAGGGIGDEIEDPAGDPYELYRILFDITFFFFVIVILLAIIQGTASHR